MIKMVQETVKNYEFMETNNFNFNIANSINGAKLLDTDGTLIFFVDTKRCCIT